MEVEKMVKLINEEGKSLKQVAETAGVSKSTVQRKITSAGYVYDSKTKTYYNLLENDSVNGSFIDIDDEVANVVVCSDVDVLKNENVVENEKMVNGSYTIPFSVAKALKLKAVLEDRKAIDIVREAIEKVIEERYFNM